MVNALDEKVWVGVTDTEDAMPTSPPTLPALGSGESLFLPLRDVEKPGMAVRVRPDRNK